MFAAGAKEGELQRALALVSYYKGYHVFGCHHQVIGSQNITVFANVGDDMMPDFKCFQVTCDTWSFKLFKSLKHHAKAAKDCFIMRIIDQIPVFIQFNIQVFFSYDRDVFNILTV